MAFLSLSWVYKETPTATKLNQLGENIVAHDHRSDGTQGSALVGQWVAMNGIAGSGWSLAVNRYRLLLGGTLVQWDVSATRTGSALSFNDHTTNGPGNLAGDPTILSGIPVAARPDVNRYMIGVRYGVATITVRFTPAGSVDLTDGTPGVTINNGDGIQCQGVSWLT